MTIAPPTPTTTPMTVFFVFVLRPEDCDWFEERDAADADELADDAVKDERDAVAPPLAVETTVTTFTD